MRVYIDGTDITDFIKYQGLKVGRHDVDGPNAGRNIAGTMIRDRVATKGKWDVQLTGVVKAQDAQIILTLVQPATFSIKTDLPTGTLTTYNVYTNNIPVQFSMQRPDGSEYYSGVTIPIVEL